MSAYKTIVVTGGAGFIGANFIHSLFKKYGTSITIHTIDALTYAGNLDNLSNLDPKYNHYFHHIDIRDKTTLTHFFDAHTIDAIVHFAAESHVDRSIEDSSSFITTNVIGTQQLLDIVNAFKIKKFVHVSTDEVYGSLGDTGSFFEHTPIAPNSPYAASKASSDLIVKAYYKTHQTPVCITRCSNNYGPYQFPEKLIPLMISNALTNKPLPIYGNGKNVRDWIYVDDHCDGVNAVLQSGKLGEIYNLGGNAEKKNIDLVKQILRILGKDESLITYVTDRAGHDYRYAMNFSKATTELNWTPKYTFEDGLQKTIEWYLKNQEWLNRVLSGEYHKKGVIS